MDDDHAKIEEQIARCRRLVGVVTDVEIRKSLEALAEEYEAQLPGRGRRRSAGFMLRHK